MISDKTAFIVANTRPQPPSHVPELLLHLADDAVALWELTEEQLGEIGLPPPFWAFAWAGGQALARYVLDHPDIVRGRAVLDVASGSGPVAVAAMKAGAACARAVDLDPFAAAAGALNAALNGVVIETRTEDALESCCATDVILVGDLFYDRDLSPRLLAWLQERARDGATILIGDPGRTYLPKDDLTLLAEYAVPTPRALEDGEVKRTGVWTLKGWGL